MEAVTIALRHWVSCLVTPKECGSETQMAFININESIFSLKRRFQFLYLDEHGLFARPACTAILLRAVFVVPHGMDIDIKNGTKPTGLYRFVSLPPAFY